MLPTFARRARAQRRCSTWRRRASRRPGLHYGFDRVLHGEQYTEIRARCPTHGKLDPQDRRSRTSSTRARTRSSSRAITHATTRAATELAYNELTTFVRGAGGWGGERGPSARRERAAGPRARRGRRGEDERRTRRSSTASRATGTRSTPTRRSRRTSASSGPSCTGSARSASPRATSSRRSARAATRASSRASRCASPTASSPARRSMTEMWKESDDADRLPLQGQGARRGRHLERGGRALQGDPEGEAEAGGRSAAPRPRRRRCGRRRRPLDRAPIIFAASTTTSRRTPSSSRKVGKVFQFKLTSPDSAWTLDVKNGKGSCTQGDGEQPDVHARAHRRRLPRDDERQGRRDEALHRRQAQDQRQRDGVAEARCS